MDLYMKKEFTTKQHKLQPEQRIIFIHLFIYSYLSYLVEFYGSDHSYQIH